MFDETPLDADELMNLSERIETLPPEQAEWVGRLFRECLRARMHEAELSIPADPEACGEGSAVGVPDEDQLAQLALDTAEWLRTLWDVGYMGGGSFPQAPRSAFPQIELEDVVRSALFKRIREGKRPLPFPPPTRNGLPWHELIDGGCAVHAVDAEIARDAEGGVIGAIVEGCREWRVLVAPAGGNEFLLQHNGQGPLFRLLLGEGKATLRRQPPEFACRIRRAERGGIRGYLLAWPGDAGHPVDVPLRAATWERAEAEAGHWIARHHPAMYGRVSFEREE